MAPRGPRRKRLMSLVDRLPAGVGASGERDA